jgi:DNA-directed RNA polymerase subunit RPC12/RpoP
MGNIGNGSIVSVPKAVLEQPDYECECGSKIFKELLKVKKISALLSPTGREALIPYEVLICNKCEKEIDLNL